MTLQILLRPDDDDGLRGSKHVARINCIIHVVLSMCCVPLISLILFNTYTTGMAPVKAYALCFDTVWNALLILTNAAHRNILC
jgi:hypothetical protein